MNCFQNCIFTYDSQPKGETGKVVERCELLSELYFYLWFPTFVRLFRNSCGLWIAFRIVFLLMIPNKILVCLSTSVVVNCFQNCIFTYDSQLINAFRKVGNRCELLSELYFYLWFPTYSDVQASTRQLWIAFRIVFLLMIPNRLYVTPFLKSVVNCFQNCIFTYDSQLQQC